MRRHNCLSLDTLKVFIYAQNNKFARTFDVFWGGNMRVIYFIVLILFTFTLGCSPKSNPIAYTERKLKDLQDRINAEKLKEKPNKEQIERDENLLQVKRTANYLYNANMRMLSEKMMGHTDLYSLKGKYKVLVIPVEFANKKMVKKDFFVRDPKGKSPAQDYLFGDSPYSMKSYFRHASFGQLDVIGEVTDIVQAPGSLEQYGEAVDGNSDKDARGLVKETLIELMKQKQDTKWWESFDNWDLADYDNDGVYAEPDGFIDAVILLYAGKDQALCQAIFDPDGARPASADVPEGPRKAATVECFNRIWPHRWTISIDPKDPLFSERGPLIEGAVRPSFNGLKITDKLFALDYNMQSEFSERSTFMHEFGHSLTLPDVYSFGGENSSGSWELMSSNAPNEAQELSSYSKLSLGWLQPKIVKQGQKTALYMGAYNFVSPTHRDPYSDFNGPTDVEEWADGQYNHFSIVSQVPGSGEPVYRSAAVLTDPTTELVDIVDIEAVKNGKFTAYSGKFNSASKSLKIEFDNSNTINKTLSIDIIWAIETDHNFDSSAPDFGMTGDFDLGEIYINGELKEQLRMFSGDQNLDSLVEANPDCLVDRVKELRLKKIAKTWTEEEITEFNSLLKICRKPVWMTKTFDLSSLTSKNIEIEIRYTTDPGYNEMGIVVDNIKLDAQNIDFENGDTKQVGAFKLIEDGKEQIHFHQFYLMEYRTPGEAYQLNGQTLSYNMDNNIEFAPQTMFLKSEDVGSENPLKRLRLIKFNYQSGLVVWYFNSKFHQRENEPEDQEGKGYLLVLNSKVKELKLPGTLGAPELFDEQGNYLKTEEVVKILKPQRDEFKCFGYTQYATYIFGEAPDCGSYKWQDALQTLSWDRANLLYNREFINDVHPLDRELYKPIEQPYRNNATMRTGLAAFRPKSSTAMSPLTIFKVENGEVVKDLELTRSAMAYEAVSSFKDSENMKPENAKFLADTVLVEKHGLRFNLVEPDSRITERYVNTSNGDTNDNFFRRPRVKVLLDWSK